MIPIRTMTAADIDLGMRLKSQAGWNQLSADWLRMLVMQPDGCFVAELDGVAVGTAVACLFGKVAWIAMVLVDASVRGRGIGKALMQHALDFADCHGASTVRLDATPLGQPLYESMGFVPQYSLTRFSGQLFDTLTVGSSDSVVLATAADAMPILEWDAAVTGTDRGKFLLRLLHEQPARAHVIYRDERLAGFVMMRPGSNAWQLGPCIARLEIGEVLLRHAGRPFNGQAVFVDIPEPNAPAMQWAVSSGLQSQRRLLRMCRGAVVNDDTSRLWASSGPELG